MDGDQDTTLDESVGLLSASLGGCLLRPGPPLATPLLPVPGLQGCRMATYVNEQPVVHVQLELHERIGDGFVVPGRQRALGGPATM